MIISYKNNKFKILNVSCGQRIPLRDFVKEIEKNLKLKAKSSLFDPSYIKTSTEININYTKEFKQIITSYDKIIKLNKIIYFILVFISITISFYLLLTRVYFTARRPTS